MPKKRALKPSLPPPRRTTVPYAFLTQHTDVFMEPIDRATSAHSTNVAVVTPKFTQAALTTNATGEDQHSTQVDNISLKITSFTPPTASFLGLPTEIRCMIYNHLWGRKVDVYIESPDLKPSNAIHPIFHTCPQIRSEAIDSLRENKTVAFVFCAIAEDLDFRNITAVLKTLDRKYIKHYNIDAEENLNVRLTMHHKHIYRPPLAPGSFAKFISRLKELGLKADYEYHLTADDRGTLRQNRFACTKIRRELSWFVALSGDEAFSRRNVRARRAVASMISCCPRSPGLIGSGDDWAIYFDHYPS